MKKVFSVLFLFLFVFALNACDKGYLGEETTLSGKSGSDVTTLAQTNYVDDLKTILENNGYTLTVHDASSIQYFTDNTYAGYSLDGVITHLIMGDVGGNDWIQIVAFETEQAAIDYANALENLTTNELVYRSGNAVLMTYSQTALDLFN